MLEKYSYQYGRQGENSRDDTAMALLPHVEMTINDGFMSCH